MTIRLSDPSQDRYQRLRLIRWWDQEKLKNSSVLVVGAGALGNEVIKNLALLGIGQIWIADFDRIETTNLTRSVLFRQDDVGQWKAEILAQRTRELNPDCNVQPLIRDVRHELGLAFLNRMDLIFGCLDNREARYYINRFCFLLQKCMIDGGLDTLNGSVTVFQPPDTACYECTLGPPDRAELQKRISCLKNPEPEIKNHVPTAPTIASIVGGMQAQIGVRSLHGLSIPSGKRIGLYGLSDVFFEIQLEKSDDCGLHSSIDPLPRPFSQLECTQSTPLHQILSLAEKKWSATAISWDFDRDLAIGLKCISCTKDRDFVGTVSRYDQDAFCECGGAFKSVTTTSFDGSETWGVKTVQELGFPEEHVYAAETPQGRIYFELIGESLG